MSLDTEVKPDPLATFTCCGGKILLGHDRVCKLKEVEPCDQDKVSGPAIWYDNEKLPNTMYVSIPLHVLAKNPSGIYMVDGFIHQAVLKLALGILRQLQLAEQKKNERVIVPGGAGNGQTGVAGLQVH